jgi:hypothetical protein
MSAKRLAEARASGLQVYTVIDLPSLLGCGVLNSDATGWKESPPGLSDLLGNVCIDTAHHSVKWLRALLEEGISRRVFASKLEAMGRLGVFLRVGYGAEFDTVSSEEWAIEYETSAFVYGDTFDEAWELALDWLWSQRPWIRALPLLVEEINEAESTRGIAGRSQEGGAA